MHKLVEEREAAERELKSLAAQLDSRTGADAADAGDMHSLRSYWRENERLQKVCLCSRSNAALDRYFGHLVPFDVASRQESEVHSLGTDVQE